MQHTEFSSAIRLAYPSLDTIDDNFKFIHDVDEILRQSHDYYYILQLFVYDNNTIMSFVIATRSKEKDGKKHKKY